MDYIESFQNKRMRWIGIALLQPIIIAGLYFPAIQGKTVILDWMVRAILLGIVVWTRQCLLASFRNRPFRHAALVFGPLVVFGATFGTWRSASNEIAIGLRILDALLNGYLLAMVSEPLVAAVRWAVGPKGAKTEEQPFKIAERMRYLRRSVNVLQKTVFVQTILMMLGLYTLGRAYLFDWVLYSRLAAGFIGIGFIVALIILDHKIKRMEEKEMQWVEREIETSIDTLLAWRPPGQEQFDPTVLTFWQNYRHLLIASQRAPLTWEVWASILLLQGLLLIEPYIVGLWAL